MNIFATASSPDSPWDESADDPSTTAPATAADREWDRLRERYVNAGYREGITAGKASTVQAGFNQGFAAGAQAGRQLGELRGTAAYVLARLLAVASPAADPTLVEAARTLVRDLGRLGVEDILGPDTEALEHAREHGEVDVDALANGVGGLGATARGPTIDECRQRLDQLCASCGLPSLDAR